MKLKHNITEAFSRPADEQLPTYLAPIKERELHLIGSLRTAAEVVEDRDHNRPAARLNSAA